MVEVFKPVRINEYFLRQIAFGLKKSIYDSFFKEIFAILDDKTTVYNSKNTLVEAIQSGRIYYENGAFKARKNFSNTVANELEKIGAKYKYGAYYIERALIPAEIESTIAIAAAREAAKITALDTLLVKLAQDVGKDTLTQLFIEKAAYNMFKKLQADLEESTKERKVPVIDLGVKISDVKLDDSILDPRAKKIAEDYTYNMDYWVKNWKAKEIVKMRMSVQHLVQNGARTETIKKYFQDRWGIAGRKAEFLARNESGIAGSVLKATHYQEMGCSHFMWLKSTSKEKRELHLEYAKKTNNQYGIGGTNIFAFDNPPIIDERTGQRGLPQQTYNCSCGMVGIKNPQYYINKRKIENAKRNIFKKIKYTIENCLQRNNNPWRYRRFGQGQAV